MPMICRTCGETTKMLLAPTWIAKICHEANRAFCSAIGDNSQVEWDAAPAWQQDSCINGVNAHLAQNLGPEDSHNSWLEQKRAEGWKYGPIKDASKKVHPCFVPYAELPAEERMKDYIFGAIVGAFKDFR